MNSKPPGLVVYFKGKKYVFSDVSGSGFVVGGLPR